MMKSLSQLIKKTIKVICLMTISVEAYSQTIGYDIHYGDDRTSLYNACISDYASSGYGSAYGGRPSCNSFLPESSASIKLGFSTVVRESTFPSISYVGSDRNVVWHSSCVDLINNLEFRGLSRVLSCTEHYYYVFEDNCPNGSIRIPGPVNSLDAVGQCETIPINNGFSCENNTSHPINIPTGNKFFRETLYFGQAESDLAFNYFYNSSVLTGNYAYPIKAQWGFSYRQALLIGASKIIAMRDDGKAIVFPVKDGVLENLSHRKEKLVRLSGNKYELTLVNNDVETYDRDGRLVSVRFTSGHIHQLNYDNPNSVVVNNGNNELILQTDADDLVVGVILPDGVEIHYQYDEVDEQKRLLIVRNITDNTTRQYVYEDTRFPNYITGIIDENGNRISSVQYDDQGRAISSEAGPLNSGIERTQIQYNEDGTRTLTNALGKQSTYHFTQFNGEYKMTQVEGHASANCAAANQAYTYDANGFMASKTDWAGNITTYIHNDRGQETSRTEASGTPQARTITTQWHAEFNLPIKITEPKRETVMSYDANGRLLSRDVSARSGL